MWAAVITSAFCLHPSDVGRVDYSSMDQQSLMELLVSNMTGQTAFKSAKGEFSDVCQWQDIKIGHDGEVLEISFEGETAMGLFDFDEEDGVIPRGGSIDLQWLPSSLLSVHLFLLELDGTVETMNLPKPLLVFDISCNKFTGTFAMETLPPDIEEISIEDNQFHGELNLKAKLPHLKFFNAHRNKFSGTLDLSSLPKGIQSLTLTMNRFSGSIDKRNLPKMLVTLDLDKDLVVYSP